MVIVDTLDGLAPSEAARLLHLSRARIDQLINIGDLDVVQTPLGRVVTRESVARLARERLVARKAVERE